MPVTSNNVFETNKLTDLVALRALVASGYVTVGAVAHFKDQLIGKRNGQTYGFVLRDTGVAVNSLSAASDSKKNLSEKIVNLSLEPWHVYIETNAIEGVTDVRWDDEVAKPNGAKLANGMIRDAIKKDFAKPAVTIVGSGFQPLAEASAHLTSMTSDKLYGFCDPKIQAILTSNGQQFNPVGSPSSFYKQGLLGEFHQVEYRSQRFFPAVKVSEALATELASATATITVNASDASKMTVTLTGVTEALPAGLPIMLEGVYACDIIGDATNNLFSFIVPAGTTGASFDIDALTLVEGGTMDIAKEDGSAYEIGDLANIAVAPVEAGVYYMAQVRAEGSYEFETLDKLDVSNADSKIGSVEGVTVHENRVIDLEEMINGTRWDIVALYGIVERRAVVNVLCKA